MIRPLRLLPALALAVSLAACGTDDSSVSTGAPAEETPVVDENGAADDVDAEDASMVVTGTLVPNAPYTPAEGDAAVITLNDMTIADPDNARVAESTVAIEGDGSAIPFELPVDTEDLESFGRYSVRGTIVDAEGNTLWSTNRANFIDATAATNDLGELSLSPVSDGS